MFNRTYETITRRLQLKPWFPSTTPDEKGPTQITCKGEQTTGPSPRFPYKKLSGTDIRLVKLLPGDNDDSIECLVDQIPLDSEPKYYALSYVWGDPSDTRKITLNGQPFDVTKNLYEALYQFRQLPELDYVKDYIWIDAICINQSDDDEKSREVPRMTEIYRCSIYTLIWLGPCGPPTGKSYLRKFLRKTLLHRDFGSKASHLENITKPTGPTAEDVLEELFKKWYYFMLEMPDEDLNDDEEALRRGFGNSLNALLKAVAEILTRPWFSRTWTIQEACMCKYSVAYIGRHCIPLGALEDLVKMLYRVYRPIMMPPGVRRIVAVSRIRNMHDSMHEQGNSEFNPVSMGTAEAFARLLVETQHKKCQNPRDQIYGILGLLEYLGKDIPAELMPDYKQPYEELYWRCTAYIIRHTGSLQLLGCTGNKVESGPSWVADFRYLLSINSHLKCKSSASLSPDDRTLSVHGFMIGTYEDYIGRSAEITISPQLEGIHDHLSSRLREIDKQIITPSAEMRDTTIEECLDGFFKTSRVLLDRWGIESCRGTFRQLCDVRDGNFSKLKKELDGSHYSQLYFINEEFKSAFMLLSDGSVARLLRQNIEVQPGDVVCLFKGAAQASVLRPCGGDYTFLTQCDIRTRPLVFEKYDESFWEGRELTEFRLV
ncbi:heterokaryon incompatibility protein-domain-containing protein [Daldinia eschscholtzii]|nr:heterokaryon incompatibility protein-domain-containing protein [Daldinia eschscholtzii]